jgi:hypothetical protein
MEIISNMALVFIRILIGIIMLTLIYFGKTFGVIKPAIDVLHEWIR